MKNPYFITIPALAVAGLLLSGCSDELAPAAQDPTSSVTQATQSAPTVAVTPSANVTVSTQKPNAQRKATTPSVTGTLSLAPKLSLPPPSAPVTNEPSGETTESIPAGGGELPDSPTPTDVLPIESLGPVAIDNPIPDPDFVPDPDTITDIIGGAIAILFGT